MKLTLDSLVRDVLRDYPPTGAVFLQHGRLLGQRAGDLYPTYDPGLTVAAFAAKSEVDPMALLRLLRAMAEGYALGRRAPPGSGRRSTPRRTPVSSTISLGYTGGHREPGEEVEVRPVVEVQLARGPV